MRQPEGPSGPEAAPLSAPAQAYAGESGPLRARLNGTLVAAGAEGLVWLSLRTGERVLRPLPRGVAGLSMPDEAGRVVRLHRRPVDVDDHRLELVGARGERRTLLNLGDGREPARHLALSPEGHTLAWVGRGLPDGEDVHSRMKDWAVGPVRLLDTEAGEGAGPREPGAGGLGPGVQAIALTLVGHGLSWFSDGRHLAVVVHGPRGARLRPSAHMPVPDPVVLSLDTHTGERRLLGPGRQVWASVRGRTVLVRLHRMALPGGPKADGVTIFERDAWAYRPTALALLDPTALPAGATAEPPRLPRSPPEITAVVGWLDDRYLVYRGNVTPGAPSGLTIHNSPLVGPKPLEAVKVMDVQTGEFLTVLEGVDPRARLGVR